jgi:hypothetical protein
MIISNLERRNRHVVAFRRDSDGTVRRESKRDSNRRARADHRRALRDPRTW